MTRRWPQSLPPESPPSAVAGPVSFLHIMEKGLLEQPLYIYNLKVFIYSFISSWLHWVFVAGCELSLVAASGSSSLVALCGPLIVVASLVSEHGL